MNVHMHTQLQLVRIKYIQKHVQRVTTYSAHLKSKIKWTKYFFTMSNFEWLSEWVDNPFVHAKYNHHPGKMIGMFPIST